MKQRYTIEVFGPDHDLYPNNFKCWVTLRDNQTGSVYKRRGYGKFIGNFSPIWVNLHGTCYQLTELDRMTYD